MIPMKDLLMYSEDAASSRLGVEEDSGVGGGFLFFFCTRIFAVVLSSRTSSISSKI